MNRFQKGQQENIHRPVGILEGKTAGISIIHRRQMNAALLHQPAAKSQSLGGIMVAADEENLRPQPG